MEYKEVVDIISTRLNSNPYGIIFDVDMYNSEKQDYEKEYDVQGSYNKVVKRVVPTMITAPYGDNLLVPNTNAIDGSVEIVFDIFIEDNEKMVDKFEQDKFASVNYNNTLKSIQEFTRGALLKPLILGEELLHFGGQFSQGSASGTTLGYNTIYLDIDILDYYNETIFKTDTLTLSRSKTGTLILNIDGQATLSTVNYELGRQKILIHYDSTNGYTLNNSSSSIPSLSNETMESFSLGDTSGLNCKLYDLRIGDTTLDYSTIDNVDDIEWNLMYNDFEDDFTNENKGSTSGYTLNTENTLLWGDGGYMLLGFTNLIPVDGIDRSKGYDYQLFSLTCPFLYSTDVIFGKNFRYFLNVEPNELGEFDDANDFEVFTIDRQHTYTSEDATFQAINANVARGAVSESARGLSKTFLYQPKRELTELLRKVMTYDIEQNQVYRITVQAPFFKTQFYCYVNNGGGGTEMFAFSTFTIEFKDKIE